ncbi:Transcriptional regulatory protein btr [Thiomonas sp. X19]|uniref:helix-turn-helix domain-containing protein n=1 Tax=Thiomonas sp. X19 TaxID=1050370 RepID=UPI000B6522CA|nr:helix-turn-helix domain-containing protein [Thiomonas sp. X19]SCC94636.1 Transcriptional regulatory protein btr [Thiomonas sp. X19]
MKAIPTAPMHRMDKPHPCDVCFQSRFCLPISLPQDELVRMRDIMQTTIRLTKGERLFEAGQPMDKVFSVHAGSFKSMISSPDGRQQIVGFHVPGELMGLEGFSARIYMTDVIALEDGEACEIDVRILENNARELPTLQQQIHCLIGNRLARAQQDQFVLGSMQADERLARFLLDLSERYKSRGLSPEEFVLRMSREEIGSYLGLKLETISRLMSRFHQAGLVHVAQRQVRITNREGLTELLVPQEH